MRGRVLLVVALAAVTGYLGYRYRDRIRPPAGAPTDAGVVAHPIAGAPDAGAAGPLPLAGPDGTALEITLLNRPAERYAARSEDDDADHTYRELCAALGGDAVHYDRDLSRAAREVAYQAALLGEPPPEAVLVALLHASGAAEVSAMQLIVHASSDDPSVLRDTVRRALARPVDGRGLLRIGVGEASTPDEPMSYHVAVLVTRRAYDVDPTLRSAPPGSTWTLRGTLPAGYRDASAWALYPDGRTAKVELHVRGRRFELVAPTGDREGTMYASISGADDRGPGKLLQLAVEIGREPPRTFSVVVPPADPELPDLAAAEAYALQLLEADRARFGLPPLAPDPVLSEIARAHSTDMRDRDFFAHLSPTTGLASDRLAAADYRATTHAENIALNDSITEAESSLLGSIGHRLNIIDPRFTHVGIGLAQRARDDEPEWYLTQLFARPVAPIDEPRAIAAVLSTIDTRRAQAGVGPLARDAALAAIAQRGARAAADGDVEDLARRTGAEVRALTGGGAVISVQALYDLEAFEPPDAVLEPDAASIGVGVHQSEQDLRGRTGVVLILAR